MVRREYDVARVRGDRMKILKTFGDNKEAALEYGKEIAKKNKKDVIVCLSGAIKNNRKIIRQDMIIYKVWENNE